jgi:serine/threonine-protein kinase
MNETYALFSRGGKPTLFGLLAELDPQRRREVLAARLANRPKLRTELEALLAQLDSVEGDLTRELDELLQAMPRDPVPPLPAGFRFGRYEVVGELGRGGMGTVYEARRIDDTSDSPVALKFAQRRGGVAELRREARLLEHLRHPNIAALIDIDRFDEESVYLIMERVHGVSLRRHVADTRPGAAAVVGMVATLAEAVAFAHSRSVHHGDIKPENVLVESDGRLKLLDFGVAVFADSDEAQARARGVSLGYAAPEVVRGQPLTAAADVFALGVTLYEMLAGKRPYADADFLAADTTSPLPPPPLVLPGASTALRQDANAIVARAAAWRPQDRYASVAEMATDLRNAGSREILQARSGEPGHVLRRTLSRQRWLIGIVASAFIAVTILAIRAELQSHRLERQRAVTEQQRQRAELTSQFLLQTIQASSPEAPDPARLTVAAVAKRAAEQLDKATLDDDVRAALLRTFAEIDRVSGGFPAALEKIRAAQALPAGDEAARYEMSLLQARVLIDLQRADEAEPVLAALQPPLPADAAWRLPWLRAAIALARDDYRLSERELRVALEPAAGAPQLSRVQMLGELSTLAERLGRHAEAVEHAETQRREITTLADAPPLLAADNALRRADSYMRMARFDDVEKAVAEAMTGYAARLGKAHPRYAGALIVQGRLDVHRGNYELALEHAEEARQILRASLGERYPRLIEIEEIRSDAHSRTGHAEQAITDSLAAIAIVEMTDANSAREIAIMRYDVAGLLGFKLRYAEAIAQVELALPVIDRTSDPQSVSPWLVRDRLAFSRMRAGDTAGAATLFRQIVPEITARIPAGHQLIALANQRAATAFMNNNEIDDAVAYTEVALGVMLAPDAQLTAGMLETHLPQAIDVFNAAGDKARAEQIRQILDARRTHDPLTPKKNP